MKKLILITVVSLIAVFGLAACAGLGQGSTAGTTAPVRTLTATGTGKVYVTPDVAYINIGVRSDADNVTDALAANNLQATQISEALQAAGVDKKDIQTSNFNVYPMQNYNPDGTISRSFFQVDNTVNVTVRNLANLGSLLDTVVRSGANTINGISFGVVDDSAATNQARDAAIAAAKTEAEGIAAAAGVKLGDIQSVSVSVTQPVLPMYYGAGMGGGAAPSAEVPIASGQLLVSVDASITFAIN